MPQKVIREHKRNHRFANRYCADAYARIVPAFGLDIGLMALRIHGAAGAQDRRGWFYSETRHNRLARRDAAQNSAGVIGEEMRLAIGPNAHFVGIFLARKSGGRETRADFNALYRVY